MKPFDAKLAVPGTILLGIDASTLFAGREPLIQWRIADQRSERISIAEQEQRAGGVQRDVEAASGPGIHL